MADFNQNGKVATLHRLTDRSVESMEAELTQWSQKRPMALVLPCLYSELEGPAMENILQELIKIPFLNEVIIGIDRADQKQFEHAREFFGRLPQQHRLLWNDGPNMRAIDKNLNDYNLAPREMGKGRNVWYCMGYFLASGQSKVMALHDCDILTYSRDIVARLFYPLVHPTFNYAFSKGYYYRAANGKLNGRVTRLLVSPLLTALRKTIGPNDYTDFIESFRYPLSGEFGMSADVVNSIRIPSDWGLEIGVLSEVYRRYAPERICQVDIADAYDHKHQPLSEHDKNAGLSKMSIDICKALFRKLAINGIVFSPEIFRTLKASYYRDALDLVDRYHNDAVLNGLALDRHLEEKTVELFTQCVMDAGSRFLENPMERPFIPSWSRVTSALPNIMNDIMEAVDKDNR